MSEAEKAQTAQAEEVTLFDKIVAGQIPSTKVYEDDLAYVFKDINPVAPIHFLVIPKNRQGLSQLSKATEDHEKLLGHLMVVASKVANMTPELADGWRLVVNDGKNGCQTVYHLHLHIIGGKPLSWPPGA